MHDTLTTATPGLDVMDKLCHELRRPLAVIHAYAELLDDEVSGALNDGQKDQVLTILSAADELAILVHSLYGLAELDAGRVRTSIGTVDLNRVCARLHEQYLPRFGQANLEFALRVEDEERVDVRADPDRLRLALCQLLENALKYVPPGRRVELAVSSDGELARASVRDTGLGIPAEELERVFERYHRVTRDEGLVTVKGAGVGLTLCKAFVEAMHGRVWAESGDAPGAALHVELPVAARSGANVREEERVS
ncbi:MAG: HAMP domain-containing histidine kinase [Planctomycetes bacterium]|nr:HAMP domain-containing histidine kinase [Planctomycetota bacterium]